MGSMRRIALLLSAAVLGALPAVAVTAWRNSLTCDTFDPKMFDAIRAFRRDRVDKAPEFIP